MNPAYQILEGLPPYGPVYINIPDNGYISEGYAVRFFKSDGTSWVANFACGGTNFYGTFQHPQKDKLIFVAGG